MKHLQRLFIVRILIAWSPFSGCNSSNSSDDSARGTDETIHQNIVPIRPITVDGDVSDWINMKPIIRIPNVNPLDQTDMVNLYMAKNDTNGPMLYFRVDLGYELPPNPICEYAMRPERKNDRAFCIVIGPRWETGKRTIAIFVDIDAPLCMLIDADEQLTIGPPWQGCASQPNLVEVFVDMNTLDLAQECTVQYTDMPISGDPLESDKVTVRIY